MPAPIVLWPSIAGAVFFVAGIFAARRELQTAPGIDRWIALGGVFFAAPLAVFGGEHLSAPRIIMEAVPTWMPARLFWTYLVGIALVAAAVSLAVKKYKRLSIPLLALMFFSFVFMIHVPNVAAHASSRLFWTVALRDSVFGLSPLALAGAQMVSAGTGRSSWLTDIARTLIGVILIFFGVQECLYPEFAPGVPLPKMTPAWVPVPVFWGYLVGAVLIVCGACLLVNRYSRVAATCVGLVMAFLTFFLYAPILAMASGTPKLVEGINYVADTLLFGGALLLLAKALPKEFSPSTKIAYKVRAA